MLIAFSLFFLIASQAQAVGPDLIVDFEQEQLPEILSKKVPTPYAFRIDKTVVRKGRGAARFELRQHDAFLNDGKPDGFRVELKDKFRATPGETFWYAFSLQLPKGFPIHKNRLVLGQWNAEPDNDTELKAERSPPLSVRYSEGKLFLRLYHAKDAQSLLSSSPQTLFETLKFKLGTWNDFLFEIRFSPTQGVVRAWLNQSLVVNYQGPVGYNDRKGPYFKMGIYRDDVPETYVAYFDEYRRGRGRADVEIRR